MKFDLRNYEILPPPYPLDYANWTDDQAQDYLKWFVSKIPERVDYVCWRYHKDNIFSSKLDPDDPESLLRIWRWFIPRGKVEQKSKEEAEAQLAAYSHLGGKWLDTRRIDTCTEYVTRDIGMMMGHIFAARHPQQLYWATEKGGKHYVWRYHPVLKGFVNVDFKKPMQTALEPLHVVYTQATGLLSHDIKPDDLMRIYKVWEKDIPDLRQTEEA